MKRRTAAFESVAPVPSLSTCLASPFAVSWITMVGASAGLRSNERKKSAEVEGSARTKRSREE